MLDSRFVFSNSEPAHVSKSFRFPDFALIIEAEPSEKFHCETINTKKTKTTSTSDSNRHKKSKPFHLVGDHFFFLVPKILMEWTKSRFAKHPRVPKIRRNLTPNQFFGSDATSHYVDFCQLEKKITQNPSSANDAFQNISTSARRFRPFRSPAIRAQEIATPAEHVQLVSKLHTIADGLRKTAPRPGRF